MADLVVTTLAERPELGSQVRDMTDVWPTFMLQDPIGDMYYADAQRRWPEFTLVATLPEEPDRLAARGYAVPFAFGGEGREALPNDGWDGVIRWAWLDELRGTKPTLVSALEITIRADLRGGGHSSRMLGAMRTMVARHGFDELVAPVRPNGKPNEPDTPMSAYVSRTRSDGLPVDPWLRVHVRAGGEIVGVCPRAMVIAGTLAEWRTWTGLPFDQTGPVHVPGGLVPVHVSVEHDHAVYVEPGVWVRHRL